jgi:hypothetical protein
MMATGARRLVANAGGPLPWPPPQLAPSSPAPPSASFFARVSAKPIAFGPLLFAIGWIGILFQRGFLHQLIVGAPIFEELAKLGLALFVVAILHARGIALRLPFGWASGALFGVFEHVTTYADEEPLFLGLRIAFHAASCGLAITMYTVLERLPDTRARWASTAISSALHAANNIGALALAVVSLVAETDPISTAYSTLVTAALLTITLIILGNVERARRTAESVLLRVFPTMRRQAVPVDITRELPGP